MAKFKNAKDDFNQETRNGLVPTVIEKTPQGERAYDIFSRILKDRTIFLYDEVNQGTSAIIIAQLMFLMKNPPEPGSNSDIHLYIMSPGGDIDAGMAVYDTIQLIKDMGIKVHTYATGRSMSMGSVFLVAGSDGCRHALPNADIMIHGPAGGSQGKVEDMEIRQREINHIKHRMAMMYEAHTKMSYDEAMAMMDQPDYFMRAEEAKKLGVVDDILYPKDAKLATWIKDANNDHEKMRDEPSPGLPHSGRKPAANQNTKKKSSKTAKPQPK